MKSGVRWLLFAIGVMFGASLLSQVDLGGWLLAEPQRWKVAAAENLWLDGEHTQAIQELRETLEQGEPQLESLDLLARWGLREENFDVVHWACDQAEQQVDLDLNPRVALNFAGHRSFAFYRQRRPDEALACWYPFQEVEGVAQSGEFLNGNAYVRALVGDELSEAAKQIELALREYGWTEIDVSHRLGLAWMSAGENRQALGHYDRAIGLLKPRIERFNADFERQVGGLVLEQDLHDPNTLRTLRKLRRDRDNLQKQWLMLHAHRAMVYQRLGQSKAAEADEELIRTAGYDSAELARLTYVNSDLTGYAAILDTRGWIRFRAGQLSEAVRDLTQAAACAEVGHRTAQTQLDENLKRIVHSEELEDLWQQQKRGLAVIYDHLAQALYEVGEVDGAAKAEARVHELGFETGPQLY